MESPNELEELFKLPGLPGVNLEDFEHWLLVCAFEEFAVLLFHGFLFFFSPMAPNRTNRKGGIDIRQLNNNGAAAAQAQAHIAQANALMGR